MAEKRSQGEDIFQTIIFAAIAVVVAAFFLLKIAVTLATYLFPFVAIAAYFIFNDVSELPPTIPDAAPYDRPDIAAEVAGLITRRIGQEHLVQQCYATGDAEGIMLTKASDNTRFAERSRRGKELNAVIDKAERNIEILQNAIDHNKEVVRIAFPSLWSAHYIWAEKRGSKLAIRGSLAAAVGVAVICYSLALTSGAAFFRSLQTAVLYAPPLLISPLACGALCAYGSFFLIRKFLTDDLLQQSDPVKNEAWASLQAKWYRYSNDEIFVGSAEQRFDDSATKPSATATAPSWSSVLEVAPEAGPDEIRKAFYAARKKYNPDIAATMGEDIQKLATEKSKAINLAYEEARAAKGF